MTASAWGWKRTDGRSPVHEGDVENYQGHNLHAIVGIFGTELYWQCQACGLERRSTKHISETCPDD